MLNDVSFKKFAVISLSLFLAFNGSIALEYLNLNVPLVQQIFVFLFLTFIPGYTILRILKVHRIDEVEALLYAVGLSLFYIMFIGISINFIYPILGISKPITLKPLLVTFNITYILLLVWAYLKDKSFSVNGTPKQIVLKDVLNSQTLTLSLLLLFSILGAYVFNSTGDHSLIILTFGIIAFIPVVVLLKKEFHYLTYIIWILSISLLYVSDFGTSWSYIWGADINHEYYLSHLVVQNGIWFFSSLFKSVGTSNVNAMLSVVILNPTYSLLLNLSQVMVFKIFYPFIFSLVPVGLYKAYNNILNKKESFLASFFFISLVTFFTEMLALARQQIAELYLMLLILLIFSKVGKIVKKVLLFVFGIGLIVSHYGTNWLFLISLIVGFVLHPILYPKERETTLLKERYIIIFAVISILYYTLVSNSSIFNTAVQIGNTIINSINELFTSKAQGFYLVTRRLSGLHEIRKYIYLTTQGLIGIGILWLFINYKKTKINKEFVTLTFVWFAYNIAGIGVPYFSNALNASRVYQLTLFFLSPFEVIGWIMFFRFLQKLAKVQINKQTVLKVLSVFLAVYLLFNSTIPHKIAKEPPYYGYLDKNISSARWSNSDIISVLWIKEHKNQHPIYGDGTGLFLVLGLLGQPVDPYSFWIGWNGQIIRPKNIREESYIFLDSWNINNKRLKINLPTGIDTEDLSLYAQRIYYIFLQSDKIYTSQNTHFYFTTCPVSLG